MSWLEFTLVFAPLTLIAIAALALGKGDRHTELWDTWVRSPRSPGKGSPGKAERRPYAHRGTPRKWRHALPFPRTGGTGEVRTDRQKTSE